MKRSIILDSAPLGMLSSPPKKVGLSKDCKDWLLSLIDNGNEIIVPEITDYEVRRELILADLKASIDRLNDLISISRYLPITTVAMRKASELWAEARKMGKQTASDKAIDGDVILIAQTLSLGISNYVIATSNVKHLSRFSNAMEWQEIKPD